MFWRFTDSIWIEISFSHAIAMQAILPLGRESLNFIPLAALQLAQMLLNKTASYAH